MLNSKNAHICILYKVHYYYQSSHRYYNNNELKSTKITETIIGRPYILPLLDRWFFNLLQFPDIKYSFIRTTVGI